jgi:prolyl 4-hydroxylase
MSILDIGLGFAGMPAKTIADLDAALPALERVAALTAGGVYVPQSWSDAFRLLGLAASAGSASAVAQLSVLAPQRGAASDWGAVARGIEVKGWLTVPAGEDVKGIPQIRRYPDLMPRAACDWLIQTSRGRLQRARVYDPTTRKDVTRATRSNSAANFNLGDVQVLHFLLQARMGVACGQPLRHMEAPAVLHYAVGEEITDHYDFIDPDLPDYHEHLRNQGQRVATFLLYLNDDYEGGATDFPQWGVRQAGVTGTGLCFLNALPDGQPDNRMLHAGMPPLSGEKWIVSQFIRSLPLRA